MRRFAALLSFALASACTAQVPQRQQPTQATCTVNQAMAAEQKQDWNGAISIYACLNKQDPSDWRPVASIAGVYGNLNRPQDEQVWAQRAIALAPQQPGPYINLGNAMATQNNFTGAQAAFQKALAVAPASPLGAYSLGVLADSQGNTQSAEQWYRRALAIQPRDENAEVSLAALLGNTGRVAEAIPILQRVVAQNPRAEDAQQMLNDMQRGGTQVPAEQQGSHGGAATQPPAPITRSAPARH